MCRREKTLGGRAGMSKGSSKYAVSNRSPTESRCRWDAQSGTWVNEQQYRSRSTEHQSSVEYIPAPPAHGCRQSVHDFFIARIKGPSLHVAERLHVLSGFGASPQEVVENSWIDAIDQGPSMSSSGYWYEREPLIAPRRRLQSRAGLGPKSSSVQVMR